MNQVYRVVFNRSLGVWQCVSELAKSGGKSSGKVAKPLMVAMSLVSGNAMATDYTTSTTITDNPYVVTNDIIDGKNTIITVQDVIVGNTQSGQLNITNTEANKTVTSISSSPILNANKITLGANQDVTGSLNLVDSHAVNDAVTNIITNVASDVIVGEKGTGNLNVIRRGLINIKGNLIAGSEVTSTNNSIKISEKDEDVAWMSEIIADNNIIIGDKGSAKLEMNEGLLTAKNQFILGNQQNSYGELTNEGHFSSVGKNMAIVGNAGTGIANIYNGGLYGSTLILGGLATGKGTVNIIGDGATNKTSPSFGADKLIIGDAGQGTVNISGLYDGVDSWSFGLHADELVIGNQKDSQGVLNMGDGVIDVEGNLLVGNEGSGTLNAKDAILEVYNISRNEKSQLSSVNLDGTSIHATVREPNFFAGFNANTPIKLNNSFIMDVYHEGDDEKTPINVAINPNAVLTGDVGKLPDNLLSENKPPLGFIKAGDGTLELSANSMQWTGDTIVSEGIMKINGDYTLKSDNRLGITLFDGNTNGTLADSPYGKFIFTNKADISQGGFYVFADKAIETTPNTSVWKDVVTAGELVGQFKQIEDNSPLVDFYADYSDPNKVHLQLTAPVVAPPVVTPPVTPPVVTPQPPMVTPPVAPPVVTSEPPVVTPPVAPPVVTPQPPVVTPPVTTPVTPAKSSTFVQAVTTHHNLSTLDLASVLDNAIDKKIATGTNALADNLINNTLGYNQAQLSQGTSELQPLFIGSVNRMITDSNNLATTAIIEQSTQRERNVWAKAIGTQSTKDHDGKIMGYQAKDAGIIAGADTAINDKLNLGMALSYLHTDADSDGHAIDHEMTAKNWQILGYGDYQATDDTRANFHIGAGQSDIKGERHINTFGQTTAKSDYNANTFQAGMGVNHRIGTEQKHIAPFAQINYNQVKSDAYRETGAGAFNLNVREKTYNSLRSTLGVNFKQAITPQLALTGTLAGALENGDPRTDIAASFAGTPDTTFVTKGREVGREVGVAGLGLSYKPTANTEASINYMGEWRKNSDSQGVALVISSKF